MVRVCVRIDLDKLTGRLAEQDRVAYGPDELRDWLGWEGFFPAGGRWVCQGDLATLVDDEILEIVRQFDRDGITYTINETASGPLPV